MGDVLTDTRKRGEWRIRTAISSLNLDENAALSLSCLQ